VHLMRFALVNEGQHRAPHGLCSADLWVAGHFVDSGRRTRRRFRVWRGLHLRPGAGTTRVALEVNSHIRGIEQWVAKTDHRPLVLHSAWGEGCRAGGKVGPNHSSWRVRLPAQERARRHLAVRPDMSAAKKLVHDNIDFIAPEKIVARDQGLDGVSPGGA
jgi:hypothetical protein